MRRGRTADAGVGAVAKVERDGSAAAAMDCQADGERRHNWGGTSALASSQMDWRHSVLTRGALGEVVNLTKPMIESGLGGLDRPCASLITLCSSHLGHFYGQKLPKNGHIWVHRP